jgi:hypothetical protein
MSFLFCQFHHFRPPVNLIDSKYQKVIPQYGSVCSDCHKPGNIPHALYNSVYIALALVSSVGRRAEYPLCLSSSSPVQSFPYFTQSRKDFIQLRIKENNKNAMLNKQNLNNSPDFVNNEH